MKEKKSYGGIKMPTNNKRKCFYIIGAPSKVKEEKSMEITVSEINQAQKATCYTLSCGI